MAQVSPCLLCADKGLNIRMADVQDRHIGCRPATALIRPSGCRIQQSDKGDRPCSSPGGLENGIPLGPQPGEGKADTAAGPMDEGRLFYGLTHGFRLVFHREDKTGGQLAQGPARVHQAGGVGQEGKGCQNRFKALCGFG